MTPYDLWLYFLQTFLGTVTFFKDHPTVPGVIILILRQNSIRKVINKQLPKKFRDTVDADILEIKQDIKEIKREMGIEECSNLQLNGLKTTPIPLYRRFFLFLQTAMQHPKRRMIKMNSQNINYMTLVPTLLAATKLVLQLFGIKIPDEGVNEVVNGVASLGTAIGIFLPHTKVAKVAETVVKLAPEINATYKEMYPMIKQAHDDINLFLKDVERNDGSQAFNDGAQFYNDLKFIIDAHKRPIPVVLPDEPLPIILEQQVSA